MPAAPGILAPAPPERRAAPPGGPCRADSRTRNRLRLSRHFRASMKVMRTSRTPAIRRLWNNKQDIRMAKTKHDAKQDAKQDGVSEAPRKPLLPKWLSPWPALNWLLLKCRGLRMPS